MSEITPNGLTLKTNEKSVEFEIELSMNGYQVFCGLVKKGHYLFNPDLMRLRTAYIAAKGVEPLDEIKQVPVDALKGFVQRISLKTFKSPVELDDLELYYIVDRNTFFMKFLSSVSEEFDYLSLYKRSKGA